MKTERGRECYLLPASLEGQLQVCVENPEKCFPIGTILWIFLP
jgi:hypothetical protein